jgi:hypothetical protein
MSKVLVDRELLERCVDRWACCAIVETPGAEQAWLELRAVVKAAQPAEAEGADVRKIVVDSLVGMIAGVTRMIPPADQPLPDFIQAPVDRAVERINAALSAVTAERDKIKADYEYLLKNAHSLNGALTNTERDRIAVTAERDRLREEVERIALENDGHDQRRIRWAEELKQLRAEVERLREAELLLLSVCNDLMRHENADVRMVTCIELNNWLTRRAAMDAKEA